MKRLLRIPLFVGMLLLASQTALRYAFDFEDGYPLYPVIILGLCFSAYVRLRPQNTAPRSPVCSSSYTDPLLVLILAVLASGYLLNLRGEPPFTLGWLFHLSALAFFAILLPLMTASACGRAKTVVATLTALALAVMFWRGTVLSQGLTKISHGAFESQSNHESAPGLKPA